MASDEKSRFTCNDKTIWHFVSPLLLCHIGFDGLAAVCHAIFVANLQPTSCIGIMRTFVECAKGLSGHAAELHDDLAMCNATCANRGCCMDQQDSVVFVDISSQLLRRPERNVDWRTPPPGGGGGGKDDEACWIIHCSADIHLAQQAQEGDSGKL